MAVPASVNGSRVAKLPLASRSAGTQAAVVMSPVPMSSVSARSIREVMTDYQSVLQLFPVGRRIRFFWLGCCLLFSVALCPGRLRRLAGDLSSGCLRRVGLFLFPDACFSLPSGLAGRRWRR